MGKPSSVFLQFAEGRDLLERAVDSARQGHRFTLEPERFIAYLVPRLPKDCAGVTLAQVLENMHLRDLYLACACVQKEPQVPEAIAELEQLHLAELRSWLHRTDSVVDEVCQRVRIELLVGLTGAGPRLATYEGRGSLQNWINVVASRLLPPRHRPSPGGTPEDDLLKVLEALPFQGPDAEAELNKRRIVHEFRQALRDAFAVLSREQRQLLKWYYLDRQTTSVIGVLIGRDQSTASRQLADARKTVHDETIRLLQERLRLSAVELGSILTAIGTSFDVSISRILGEPDDENSGGAGSSTPRKPAGKSYA